MTRSVTIVNTSNWDNEDDIVKKEGWHVKEEEIRLRPGETTTFTPKDGAPVVLAESVPEGIEPTPIYRKATRNGKRDDGQVWPCVKVEFDNDLTGARRTQARKAIAMDSSSEGRPAMDGKSFLNRINIGDLNLGEVLDPNNNLDKLGNAVQSSNVSGIIDVAGDILEDLEDRFDQASDLLEDLISAGKGDKMIDLEDIRARRTRVRQARRKMAGLQKRIANERRLEDIEARLVKIESR